MRNTLKMVEITDFIHKRFSHVSDESEIKTNVFKSYLKQI